MSGTYRLTNRVRAGWELAQSDGTWKTVADVEQKPLSGSIDILFSDGSRTQLPVSAQVLSR